MELNGTILLQLAILLALMAWLSPVLFDPFLKLFEERERRIVGAADEAKSFLGSAEEKAALVEKRTAEAQGEARLVLAELRAEGQKREKEITEKARGEAGARLDEARSELFAATEEARSSLKGDADKIAADIVAKVLGRAA